jgi:hypothetical protein
MDEEILVDAAGGGHGILSRRRHSQLSSGPIVITEAINNPNQPQANFFASPRSFQCLMRYSGATLSVGVIRLGTSLGTLFRQTG